MAGCQSLDFSRASTESKLTEAEPTAPSDQTSVPPAEVLPDSPSEAIPGAPAVATSTPAPPSPAIDPSLRAQFRAWLDQDEWQVDVGWSVLSEEGPIPSRPWRWVFVAQSAPSNQDPRRKEPLPEGAEAWGWVWRGDARRATAAERATVDALLGELASEADRIGDHAAILRVRLAEPPPPESLERLAKLATGEPPGEGAVELPLRRRAAAAEVWVAGLIAHHKTDEAALAPAGALLMRTGIASELQGTLWRSLATVIAPDRLPGLADALAPEHFGEIVPVVRLAALEACVIAASRHAASVTRPSTAYREFDWPPGLVAARLSEEPVERRLVGRWAALAGHPEAEALLAAQLRDIEPSVQESAILSLGHLHRPTARDELKRLLRQGTERQQALAAEGLTAWGPEELEPLVQHPAAQVRSAVARRLGGLTDESSQRALGRLLLDPEPSVQQAAVAAAERRPTDQAIPLLLAAIEGGSYGTRKLAQLGLTRHHPAAPILPLDGTDAARRDAVRTWATSQGYSLVTLPTTLTPATEDATAAAELRGLIAAYLALEPNSEGARSHIELIRRLATPRDVAVIEAAVRGQAGPGVDVLQRELLPQLSESYAALRELNHPELTRRRDGARRLQDAGTRQTLSPELVRGMATALAHEQDPLVWQACLGAIRDDGHPAALSLAGLALPQPWPDLRRMGADYFQRHPSADWIPALLPLLEDPQPQVQLAAIAALAATGHPAAIDGWPGADGQATGPGLRKLLTSRDGEVRWAALEALVQLRDEAATAELWRATEDATTSVQRRALQAIGRSRQPRFVEPLIRFGWTETHDGLRREALVALEQLVPVDERPTCLVGLVAPPTIEDKITCWVRWWDTRRPASSLSMHNHSRGPDTPEGIR